MWMWINGVEEMRRSGVVEMWMWRCGCGDVDVEMCKCGDV